MACSPRLTLLPASPAVTSLTPSLKEKCNSDLISPSLLFRVFFSFVARCLTSRTDPGKYCPMIGLTQPFGNCTGCSFWIPSSIFIKHFFHKGGYYCSSGLSVPQPNNATAYPNGAPCPGSWFIIPSSSNIFAHILFSDHLLSFGQRLANRLPWFFSAMPRCYVELFFQLEAIALLSLPPPFRVQVWNFIVMTPFLFFVFKN